MANHWAIGMIHPILFSNPLFRVWPKAEPCLVQHDHLDHLVAVFLFLELQRPSTTTLHTDSPSPIRMLQAQCCCHTEELLTLGNARGNRHRPPITPPLAHWCGSSPVTRIAVSALCNTLYMRWVSGRVVWGLVAP